MKQFIEFVPLILFFVVYQMNGETIEIAGWSHTVDGIYSATKALMAATLITLPIIWLLAGELEKRLIWTSVAVFCVWRCNARVQQRVIYPVEANSLQLGNGSRFRSVSVHRLQKPD